MIYTQVKRRLTEHLFHLKDPKGQKKIFSLGFRDNLPIDVKLQQLSECFPSYYDESEIEKPYHPTRLKREYKCIAVGEYRATGEKNNGFV